MAGPSFRSDGGIRFANPASPGTAGTASNPVLWADSAAAPNPRWDNGVTNYLLFSPTAGSGLSFAYGSATSAAQNTLALTTALGTPTITDSATPQAAGGLLVQNNAGTIKLLQVGDQTTTGILVSGPFNFGGSPLAAMIGFINTSAATGGAPVQTSVDFTMGGTAWDGAASRTTNYDTFVNATVTGSSSYNTVWHLKPYRAGVSGPDTVQFSYNGTTQQWGFQPATQISSISQGATNTTGLTIAPNVADGASSVGVNINTTTTLSNASSRVLSIANNGTVLLGISANGNVINPTNSYIVNTATAGIGYGTANTLTVGTLFDASYVRIFGGDLRPHQDNLSNSGVASVPARWIQTASYWYDTKVGAQLAAASTITPTSAVHHVTGATTINIIATTNVPASGNVYITLIADSTINLGSSASAGGIKIAPTAITSGKAMTFFLDQGTSLWYPVQGG